MSRLAYSLLLVCLLAVPTVHAQEEVRACHSTDPLYARLNTEGEWIGLWPSVLDLIFEQADIDYSLHRESRKRCTEVAADGSPNGYEVAVGRVLSPDRLERFWPIPVFQHYSIVFSSKNAYPDGLVNLENEEIARYSSDLLGYRQCAFQGWSEDRYWQRAGYPDELDIFVIPETDSDNRFARALELLVRGRCEIVEFPVSAMLTIEPDDSVMNQVNCFALDKEPGDFINLLVSRNSPRGQNLALKLYESVTVLQNSQLLQNEIRVALDTYDTSHYPDHIQDCASSGARPL